MSVHYKFKSALEYDTVTFDGLHISVADLKSSIVQQKRLGKTQDFDLQVTNAQTKEVYSDDKTLIPKNTSLLIARVPLSEQPKKSWDSNINNNVAPVRKDLPTAKVVTDLSQMEGSEDDKIKAMITQSTLDYDPSNYQKIRGANQQGTVPASYRCHKCLQPGHWIKNCTYGTQETVDIKRSTGIPRSFMVPVEGPGAPGALMTPSGAFGVPAVEHEVYRAPEEAGGPRGGPGGPVRGRDIPEDLLCSLCRDLLSDAVMIPCCGNSFCDDCIRSTLLESEDHECPDCREKDIAPTTLIPNRFLRNSVATYRNQTGYTPTPRQNRVPEKVNIQIPRGHASQNGGSSGPSTNPPEGPVPARGPRGPLGPLGPGGADESEGSAEEGDNITVTVPPAHRAPPSRRHPLARPPPQLGARGLRPPGMETPPAHLLARTEEQRAPTPTVDERRDIHPHRPPHSIPHHQPIMPGEYYHRMPMRPQGPYNPAYGVPRPPFGAGVGPGAGPGAGPPPGFAGPPAAPPAYRQPPPPGVTGAKPPPGVTDPLEAFERMIREKEQLARARERRRRSRSGSRSRSRSAERPPEPRRRSPPRSPRSQRSRPRSRTRSPFSRSRSRSPRALERGALERGDRAARRAPPPPPAARRRRSSFSISRSRSLSPSRLLTSPGHRSPVLSEIAGHGPLIHRRRETLRSPHDYIASNRPPSPSRRGPLPASQIPVGHPHPHPMHLQQHAPMHLQPHVTMHPQHPAVPYNARYSQRGMPPSAGAPGYPKSLMALDPQAEARYRAARYEQPPVPGFETPEREPYREAPREMPAPHVYRDVPPAYRPDGRADSRGYARERPLRDRPYRAPDAGLPYRAAYDYREEGPGLNPGPYVEAPYADARDEGLARRERPYRDPRDDKGRDRGGKYSSRDRRDGDRRRDDKRDRDRDREDRGEKSHDHDRERERESRDRREREKYSAERKRRTVSPPRRDEPREERGRSKDDRGKRTGETSEIRREHRKEEKEKFEEEKIKDKKPKDRKKKKKDKDVEKKKKKKEKKDKEETKIERDDTPELGEKSELDDTLIPEEEAIVEDEQIATKADSPKTTVPRAEEKGDFNNLYEGTNTPVKLDAIKNDEFILNNEENDDSGALIDEKELSFDGIELQAGAEDLDMKGIEEEVKERVPKNEMLAPMPELSKWEMDDEQSDKREPGEIVSPPPEKSGKVTSEVLKRAENAIFAKAINAIRPIEIKKISMDRVKLYSADINADSKSESQAIDNLQITIPSTDLEYRSIEINDSKKTSEKTPPPTKLSVKERLGSKVEDLTRRRDEAVMLSTVERIKSRSKTPKRTERRIIVDSNASRRIIGKVDGQSKTDRHGKRIKEVESHKSRDAKRKEKEVKKHKHHGEKKHKKVDEAEAKKSMVSKAVEEAKEVGKKSTLDEANFEPDYDENLESEGEVREAKKRERPSTPMHAVENPKRARGNVDEDDTIKLDLTNVKKRAPSETASSSGSDSSSSSSSTESERKRKRRKKKAKKRKHRKHSSDSGSESDTDSDEPKKKKKKRKHKKKTSKKKKKGKHR